MERTLYFEDFKVGEEFATQGRTLTETDLVQFAGLSGDFSSIHLNREAARKGPFGDRIFHGLCGLSIASGLLVQTGILEGSVIAFLGMEWRFAKPLFVGDTIRVACTVLEKDGSRKPEEGIVALEVRVLNQRGETAQEGRWRLLLRKRPSGSQEKEMP
jgi:acyl dehydratase